MKLAKYISQERGRLKRLCEQIGAHDPDVSRWANGKRPVPIGWCLPIERATNGQVTRKDLRPDDWHLIWDELTEQRNE